MPHRSQRYRAAVQSVDRLKRYPIAEAVELAKQTSTVKFDASIELHVRLGIDPKQASQSVRGTVKLPHGTGKTLRVAVFATGQAADEATKAGAAVVGGPELVQRIKETSATDFDLAIAAPDMMKALAPIAKTLGTRGLMPSPKNETVTPHPATLLAELMGGKVAFRSDSQGNVHQVVGRASFEAARLAENIRAFLEALKRFKPADVKGTYLQSVTLASSMGPAIPVDPSL